MCVRVCMRACASGLFMCVCGGGGSSMHVYWCVFVCLFGREMIAIYVLTIFYLTLGQTFYVICCCLFDCLFDIYLFILFFFHGYPSGESKKIR